MAVSMGGDLRYSPLTQRDSGLLHDAECSEISMRNLARRGKRATICCTEEFKGLRVAHCLCASCKHGGPLSTPMRNWQRPAQHQRRQLSAVPASRAEKKDRSRQHSGRNREHRQQLESVTLVEYGKRPPRGDMTSTEP